MASKDALKNIVDKFNLMDDLKNEGKAWSTMKFQFKPSDSQPYYLEFNADGSLSIKEGEISDAKNVFTAEDATFEDIFTGKLDSMKAFLFRKLKVAGDLSSAQKLVSLFKRAQ